MAKRVRRPLPLHIRLAILYAGAALVLAATLSFVAAKQATTAARADMLAILERTAHVAALQVDLLLSQVVADGQSVLRTSHTRPAQVSAMLAAWVGREELLAGAALCNADGQVLYAAPPALGARLSGTTLDYSTSTTISHPVTGQQVVTLPITPRRGSREGHFVVAYLRQQRLVASLRSTPGGDVGLQLLHVPQEVDADGITVEPNTKRDAITPPVPVANPIRALYRVAGAPWTVLAQIPTSKLQHSADSALRRLMPWVIFSTLIAAVAGLATALWVVYPLRRLTASAQRLARGALHERTGIHRRDEVGHLAATFDAMAEELNRKWEENTELYRHEIRRVHMLQALEDVAHAVNSTLSLDQVLETISRRSAQLVGVFVCAITLVDDQQRLRARHVSSLSDAVLRLLEDSDHPDPYSWRAIQERRVVTAYDEMSESHAPEVWRAEGVVALACAPMIVQGRAIGSLNVYSREQSYFTDEQLHILAALAAHAAVAVSNARLYEESQRKTREVRSSFRRIGAALASGLRLDDTLTLIVDLACEMLHADACLIRLLDRSGTALVARASHGLAMADGGRAEIKAGEGLSGRVAATGIPIAVADVLVDARALGTAPETGMRAYLGVPLHVKSRVIGVLSVFKREPYTFTPEEIELISSFGAQASVALENRRLYEQESRIAHTLQRSLLPIIPRDLPGMDVGEIYSPAQKDVELGGDFYDLFPLGRGRVGMVMGDVCGRGLKAAIYTAAAKYAIRNYALDDPNPASVMRRTNRSLCHQITEESMFVSIVYALIDTEAMTLTLASAGHPPAVHYRSATKTAAPLYCEGTLAGLLSQAHYAEVQLPLQEGDLLVFYTDGIIEARRGKEQWGTESLARTVAAHADMPATQLAQAIHDEAARFADDGLLDDIALLTVKITPR